MKKFLLLIVLSGMLFSLAANAQYTRYIVRLKDKNGTGFSLNNPSAYLSAKAIARRTKYNITIDSTDLPVTGAYLDSIKAVPNTTVLNVSKWLNQVCIKISDPAALTKIICQSDGVTGNNCDSIANAQVSQGVRIVCDTIPGNFTYNGYGVKLSIISHN